MKFAMDSVLQLCPMFNQHEKNLIIQGIVRTNQLNLIKLIFLFGWSVFQFKIKEVKWKIVLFHYSSKLKMKVKKKKKITFLLQFNTLIFTFIVASAWIALHIGLAHHKMAKTSQDDKKKLHHYNQAIKWFETSIDLNPQNRYWFWLMVYIFFEKTNCVLKNLFYFSLSVQSDVYRCFGWELDRKALLMKDGIESKEILLDALEKYEKSIQVWKYY